METVNDLIIKGCRQLGYPDWVAKDSSNLALLIGLHRLVPSLIPPDFRPQGSLQMLLRHYRIPKRLRNPIGCIIAQRPVINPKKVLAAAQKIGLAEVLESSYRPGFDQLVEAANKKIHDLLRLNSTTLPMRDSLISRFREIWRTVGVDLATGTDRAWVTAEGLAEVQYSRTGRKGLKRKSKVINKRSARVGRRSNKTARDELLSINRPTRERKVPGNTKRRIIDEEDMQEQPVTLELLTKARRAYGKDLHVQARDYPAGMGTPNQLGHAEILQIMAATKKLEREEDVIIATIIWGLCSYTQIAKARLFKTENGWWLETKVQMSQKAPEKSVRHLYRPTSTVLVRPIPEPIAYALVRLRKERKQGRGFQGVADRLRSIASNATVSRLEDALVTHGEVWFHLPWCIAHVAFRHGKKQPAPRSYTHVGSELIGRLDRYYKLFDSTITLRLGSHVGTGSRLTPRFGVVRSFFAAWKEYLTIPSPETIESSIKMWNVLSTGLHTLVLLTTGCRNHVMAPLENAWEIILQKGEPYAYHLSPQLDRYFDSAAKVFETLEMRLSELIEFDSRQYPYSFLSETGQLIPPSHSIMLAACSDVPAFRDFAKMDRKWTRHFTNTLLRESGCSELEVRAYHGHSEYMLHPFRRHRLERIIPDTETMVQTVLYSLGV